MTYARRLIDSRRDRKEPSASLYQRYQQALNDGDDRKASAIYRDYVRACEREMLIKREVSAQQAIRRQT